MELCFHHGSDPRCLLAKHVALQDSRNNEDARLRDTWLSSVFVRALVEVAQARGVTPEALMGCSAETLSEGPPDGRILLAEFQQLMARAIELTGDPALGLHCGLYASESSFGMISPLVSHAHTL